MPQLRASQAPDQAGRGLPEPQRPEQQQPSKRLTWVRYLDLAPFDGLIWPHLTPQSPYLPSCQDLEGGRKDSRGGAVRAYSEGPLRHGPVGLLVVFAWRFTVCVAWIGHMG